MVKCTPISLSNSKIENIKINNKNNKWDILKRKRERIDYYWKKSILLIVH